MKFVKLFTMFVAFSLLSGIVAVKTIQASEMTTSVASCANPVIKYSKPTMDKSLSGISSNIIDYKILKWDGVWSKKYIPGVNDLKTTNDMSSLLGDSSVSTDSHAWSDFSDHVHQYTYCPKQIADDKPTIIDPDLLETDETVDVDNCLSSTVKRRMPTRDKVWQKLGTDISSHPEIQKYRIRWWNGRWSKWYTPGLDDMDKKTNWLPLPNDYSRTSDNPDGTKRRMWSYFTDHVHEYASCGTDEQPDLKPVEDKPIIKPIADLPDYWIHWLWVTPDTKKITNGSLKFSVNIKNTGKLTSDNPVLSIVNMNTGESKELVYDFASLDSKKMLLNRKITLPNSFFIEGDNEIHLIVDRDNKIPERSEVSQTNVQHIIKGKYKENTFVKPVIRPKLNTRTTVGRLFKDKKTNGIYLVKDNKKSAIVDKSILDINFKDIEVEEDDANVLASLKYNAPVKVNEGTLIKIEGDSRVFIVDKDNKRHWIKNENTFNKLDYEWEDIKVVSKRVFKLQKHGAELDLTK